MLYSSSSPVPSTAQLRQWDLDHVWHPFTPMQAYAREQAPVIASGQGFHLTDIDGRHYLDGISSLWCNVHGHRVPEIDQAIRDQLDQIAHTTLLGLSSVSSIQLARRLVDVAPAGLNRVFYSDSGSTAVEAALKIAFQYHRQHASRRSDQRKLFLTIGGGYHGDTVGGVSVGSIELFHHVYGPLLFQTLALPSPGALHLPAGMTRHDYQQFCFAEVERVLQAHGQQVAAVIMEPLVQGACGILVHPPGYLRHVRELTRHYGIPLIADEVAVGFGRTGTLFACEQEQVTPDLLCLAKGLTAGYLPLAATLATDDIYAEFLGEPGAGRTFFHGHTFTGNPLGCAAALASLELIERNRLLTTVQANSARLADRLSVLQDHPHVAEIRLKGMMVGIELVQDRDGLKPFPAERRTGHLVTLAARRQGVIIRPLGDVIVLMPALAMPEALIDQLCDVAISAINEVTAQV